MGETIEFPSHRRTKSSPGSVGLSTQVPGGMTTVSGVAAATGGIRPGGIIETDK